VIHYPNFDPVAFSVGPFFGIGPLQVRWYGIMYLASFAVGWFGMRARAKAPWSRIGQQQVEDIVFYSALGAIVGGRIGYELVYGLDAFLANPLGIFTVWKGGMSFHGGLTGVLLAMWIYSRRARLPFLVIGDAITTWFAAGIFLVRVANFINGELWGKPTSPDAPWAVIVNGEARHASQLYEAFLEGIVIFVVLYFYTRKPRPVGAASGLFLLLYASFRILVEFVRVPDEQLQYLAFGWVTMGQVLSAPMLIAGAVLLARALRRRSAS
jgi:phosphatidylglycerol:prolipoprotein diacylglycerol transferase